MSTDPKGGVTPVSRRVMNLSYFSTQSARRFPQRLALAWGAREWCWQDFEARVDAFAATLQAQGVGKGDRVLIHSKNCNQMLESMFAVFRLGAVWVPTNFRLSPDEIVPLFEDAAPVVSICHADFPDHAAALTATGRPTTLLSIGTADFGSGDLEAHIQQNMGRQVPCADVEYDDPCWFFFTSGTTGRSKAAVLTHGQMAFVVTNHVADLMPGLSHEDASLVVAPLSHGAGIHQLIQVARSVPSILLAQDRFDPDEAWALVERYRVSNMFTVPTIVKLLVEHASVARYDKTSLRHIIYAGAPMYRQDQKRALQSLGKVLVQYFGLGEVTGNITVLPPALHDTDDTRQGRLATAGYARTGMQISIQDDDGAPLPDGQSGEICVCGPAVFAGYYNNPQANAKAFRNGWFRTGDLGFLDAEGFLTITGRASDMYISGGSNVYPREIEEKVLTHPAISEVAIVGVPDPRWGEAGIAVCVLKQGSTLQEAELLDWMQQKVARYKLPRSIHFWDALPRSGYGKITKKQVRAELEARGLVAQI